jgi:5-methyltetrahydrofolate--homocysteine methyltransferase
MSFAKLEPRLAQGRPLIIDSDVGASFRARGLALDTPGALGQMLRQREHEVLEHYRVEVRSKVDILSALTADTTPRALAEVGMQHRAALLTGRAVDLAFEAASESPKPVAVAGILGSDMVGPMGMDRLHAELSEHADRIAAAGSELLVARGQGSRLGLMAAVTAAASTGLPVWAVVEVAAGGDLEEFGVFDELLGALANAGAGAVLFEVSDERAANSHVRRFFDIEAAGEMSVGVLLASSPGSVRGFADPGSDARTWVSPAVEITAGGARIIGGGAGTSEAHTEALAIALGLLHPSMPAANPDGG